MNVEVRQAKVADRDAIMRFLREAYGELAPYKGEARWTWQFEENPFGDLSDGLAPVWAVFDGERIVGQIAVQEAALQIDGKNHEAGWMVDVMVLPGYRGLRLGHRLHDGAAGGTPIFVTLTMAPATRRMSEKGGAITLARVRQYGKPVRLSADAVFRYLMMRTEFHPRYQAVARFGCRVLQAHRLISLLGNPYLGLRSLFLRGALEPGSTEFVEVQEFGEEIDELWERTRNEYPVIFPRNRRFLNWRFGKVPDLAYRRFVARRDGRTTGYLVLRQHEPHELPGGTIVDLFASRRDRETIEDLVRHGLKHFGRCIGAVTAATSLPEYDAAYRRMGLRVIGTKHPTVVCRDPAVQGRLDELRDQWFFTKGDHDWDQIHLA